MASSRPSARDTVRAHGVRGAAPAPKPPLAPATPPSADDGHDEPLAARYSRLAGERFEPRRVDAVLRGLDVAIAGSTLAAASPLLAVVAVAIRVGSGKPVLYRGERVGRAGVVFTMYKFRTLAPDAESRLGPLSAGALTQQTESEVTAVGRVLRASKLDEMPQLWNVVKGDMSIVGPRPIRPAFFEELCAEIPQYWQRLVVRPGMTGFAQIRVTRNHTWAEKLAHDLEYIADRSVALYARVIAETAWQVVRRTGAACAGRPAPPPPA